MFLDRSRSLGNVFASRKKRFTHFVDGNYRGKILKTRLTCEEIVKKFENIFQIFTHLIDDIINFFIVTFYLLFLNRIYLHKYHNLNTFEVL